MLCDLQFSRDTLNCESAYIVKRNVLENRKKILKRSWNFVVLHWWEPYYP